MRVCTNHADLVMPMIPAQMRPKVETSMLYCQKLSRNINVTDVFITKDMHCYQSFAPRPPARKFLILCHCQCDAKRTIRLTSPPKRFRR